MDDPLITIKKAAVELGLSERRVRQFCEAGRLGKQYGWQWLITREELERFKKEERKPGRPKTD